MSKYKKKKKIQRGYGHYFSSFKESLDNHINLFIIEFTSIHYGLTRRFFESSEDMIPPHLNIRPLTLL